MFSLINTPEKQSNSNDEKIDALIESIDKLNDQINAFWKSINVRPEQMEKFLNSPEHFNEEEWEYLISERANLDKKLKAELNKVADPRQIALNRSTQNTQQHWLHVK